MKLDIKQLHDFYSKPIEQQIFGRRTGKTVALYTNIVGQIWVGDCENIMIYSPNLKSGEIFLRNFVEFLKNNYIEIKVLKHKNNELLLEFQDKQIKIYTNHPKNKERQRGMKDLVVFEDYQ